MLRTLAARFFQSLSRLTWLPLPAFAREGYSPCVGAYPVVGALQGFIAALVFIFALVVLPSSLAVAAAIGMLMLLTGATSEAAIARVGERGVALMCLMQLVRLLALLELTEDTVPMAFLVALPLAQLAGVAALFALPGERPAEEVSHRGRVVAVVFGALPLLMLTPLELTKVLGVAALALVVTLRLLRRRGVSRDAGFHITALVVEVAVYLALNLAWGQPVEEISL